jgi:hypothetical protein
MKHGKIMRKKININYQHNFRASCRLCSPTGHCSFPSAPCGCNL